MKRGIGASMQTANKEVPDGHGQPDWRARALKSVLVRAFGII
jgi:hypothetical protein